VKKEKDIQDVEWTETGNEPETQEENPFESYTAPKNVEYRPNEGKEEEEIPNTEKGKAKEETFDYSTISELIVEFFDGVSSNGLAYIAKENDKKLFALRAEEKKEITKALSKVMQVKDFKFTPEMYLVMVLILSYAKPIRLAVQMRDAKKEEDEEFISEVKKDENRRRGGRPSGATNNKTV
jgi:hypothetical protein